MEQHTADQWMNDPSLKGIDRSKLEMLSSLAQQGSQKSQNDLMPFLMAIASGNRGNGSRFSREEMGLIIDVIKKGKSPAETAKLERIISLMQMIR